MPMSHSHLGFAEMWLLMTFAMMIPTVLRPMVRIAGGSTLRAVMFGLGYLVIWAAMGVPVFAIVNSITWSGLLISLGWIAVGLYQLTPLSHNSLRHCRSLQANAPAFQLGIRQGTSCAIACFPLMLIGVLTAEGMALFPSLVLMLALAVFMTWEKSPRVKVAALRASGVAIVVVASMSLALGGAVNEHQHTSSSASPYTEWP